MSSKRRAHRLSLHLTQLETQLVEYLQSHLPTFSEYRIGKLAFSMGVHRLLETYGGIDQERAKKLKKEKAPKAPKETSQ